MILTMESGNNGSGAINETSGKGARVGGKEEEGRMSQQSPSRNGETTLNNNNANCMNNNNNNNNNNNIGKVSERVSVVVISSQGSTKPGTIGSSGHVTGTVIQTTANTAGSNDNQHTQSNQIESSLGQQQQLNHLQQQQYTTINSDHHQVIIDEESRRRREVLARRPSYRKILNELSSADVSAIAASFQPDLIKTEQQNNSNNHHGNHHSNNGNDGTIVSTSPYVKLVNTGGTIQLAPAAGGGTSDGGLGGLSTLTMTNSVSSLGSGQGGAIQYVQSTGQDGPFLFPVSAYANGNHHPHHHSFPSPLPGSSSSPLSSPVTVTAADLQTYQITTARASSNNNSSASIMIGNLPLPGQGAGHHPPEEQSKKREMRLQKNREAAKECRRKKKEYIKCLENRVTVLENQNKALIDELKSLKELYCQKQD